MVEQIVIVVMKKVITSQLLLGLMKFNKVIIISDKVSLILIYYLLIYKIKGLFKLIFYLVLMIFITFNKGYFLFI